MFSSHVSVTYVILCLCTNLWEPSMRQPRTEKLTAAVLFTVKAFRMWHEAILLVHCKERRFPSVVSQHVFCVVLQMISSFLFVPVQTCEWECGSMHMFSSVYCTMVCEFKCVYACVRFSVFFPWRDILPPAESEGLTDDHKVTHLLNLWPSQEAQTHIRGILFPFFLVLLWIASIPRSSPLLLPSVSTFLCSLVICTYLFLLHTSYSPLCGLTFFLFLPHLLSFFFFTTSNFALPSYVAAPFSLELMTSVQTNEIIVLTRFLWRPHAISDTIFETYCLVELARIKRFLSFFWSCFVWDFVTCAIRLWAKIEI